MDPTPRGKEATALEQAISRAMRDNLALVQHTTKELSQAIEDFVAACSSTRNANMLPAMLRAQTAAASLTSMLDVLSRVLTTSLQPARTGSSETYVAALAAAEPAVAVPEAPPPAPAAPAPAPPAPRPVSSPEPAPPVVAPPPPPAPAPERTGTVLLAPAVEIEPPAPAAPRILEHGIPLEPPPAPETAEPAPASIYQQEPVVEAVMEVEPKAAPAAVAAPTAAAPEPVPTAAPAPPAFRVEDLPAEQQELHRRANRHAKVSMQDIYLLRPKDVQLGRQNRDICTRLKGDIEKARKEYVRRFGPILEHPVDYFHHWMVEVLAEGKPEVLGEYPYPSAVPRQ